MPITKSAKKARRQTQRRRIKNLRKKQLIAKEIKKYQRLVTSEKITEAKAQLSLLYKLLDKATKTGVIKKNAASRQKSRLARLLQKKG